MGTNYYLLTDPCNHCGRGDMKIHLGKASGGWHFSFKGYRECDTSGFPNKVEKVESLADWKVLVRSGGQPIDEYGERLSSEEMINYALTFGRKGDKFHAEYVHKKHGANYSDQMIDGQSFSFQEFS